MGRDLSYSEWLRVCASDDAAHVQLLLHDRDHGYREEIDPAILLDAWSLPEWPERVLGTTGWVELFRTAGFSARPPRPAPAEHLQVFRGSTWGRRRGMAWTTDPTCARRFAERWTASGAGVGQVFVAHIGPDAVLAMIDDRGEAEVVVDPLRLPPLGRSAIMPP